jgi:flotillin
MLDGLFDFVGGGVFAIFLTIIVVVLIVSYIGSRYKVAGANEALVVSGQRDRTPDGRRHLKVVRGGGVIVLPLIHKVGKLKLTARQINVNLADAVTRQGIKVAVQGVATFKIGADDESIRNAAERFLESQEESVDSIVKNVLEGSLRSIVGTLTVEELNLDRQKFQQAVQDAAKGDLATSGLQIDSFTIQAIRDESGYMELIGQQETARRERDARMAKAAADQEAAVREAEAEQVKIHAQRDVALRRAETEATQEVTRKQTELAQLEAARTEQELVATTVRPAEAEAAAQIRRAEGDKLARIAAAQADAERVKLAGEAQARVVEVTAEATAKQTTLEGTAEAGIVLSKGEAEAKALALRAEAYRQFNEAAIIQTVLSMLPDIVRAAAEPMGNIDSLTVLSNDGASDLVKNVSRTVTEASTTVKGLTGIDIPELLNKALGTEPDSPSGGGSGGGGSRPPRSSPPGGGTSQGGGTQGGGASGTTQASGRSTGGDASAAASAGAGSGGAPAAAFVPTPPVEARRIVTPESVDAALAEADRALRAAAAPPVPRSDTAAGPARPASAAERAAAAASGSLAPAEAPAPAPATGPASATITRETTVDDAATRLAADLMAVPGIERFANVRLAELERGGPRPLRTMWRVAREQLDARYGELTIGQLIERSGRGRGAP